MNLARVEKVLEDNNFPAFRLKQIQNAVYKQYASSWDEIKVLPANLREKLKSEQDILSIEPKEILVSNKHDAIKFCFALKDGYKIEGVLMNILPEKWALCLSTQVGCAVRCTFCATGKRGLRRNLSPEEITDQFIYAAGYLKKLNGCKIHSVVFMGMGEPFLNYNSVAKAIKTMTNPDLIGLGQRHISVSTSGHVPGIRAFAKDFPQCNLAFSLHSPSDELRTDLVPLNAKYPLSQVAKALQDYITITRRRVFIEYVMLDGVNNSRSTTNKINDYLRTIAAPKYFTINLIPYNKVGGQFHTPAPERVNIFMGLLQDLGWEVTVRKSLGEDIAGACGQLAGK